MKFIAIIASIAILPFFGCIGTKLPASPPGDQIIQTSHPERPTWIMSTPEDEGDNKYFVGQSDLFKTELSARESSKRSVAEEIGIYISVRVSKMIQSIYFFNTEIEFAKQAAWKERRGKFLRYLQSSIYSGDQVKIIGQYFERFMRPTGTYYRYYALGCIPISEINRAFKETLVEMRLNAERAMKKAREENDQYELRRSQSDASFYSDVLWNADHE